MPYPSDLTDDQWDLLEPVFNAPGGAAASPPMTLDAMLYADVPDARAVAVVFARRPMPAVNRGW